MSSSLGPIYSTISNIAIVLIRFLAALFLARLYVSFVKDETKKRYAYLASAAYFAISIILYFMENIKTQNVTPVIALAVAYVIYVFSDRGNVLLKTYISVTYFVIAWVALFISVSIANAVSDFSGSLLVYIANNYVDKINLEHINTLFAIQYAMQMFIDIAMFSVIAHFVIKKLTVIYENKKKELTPRELILLLIPSLIGVASFCLYTVYSYNYEETQQYIFFGVKSAGILWNLFFIILLAAIVTTASFYQQIQEKQVIEARELMLKNSVKDIQAHINEIENIYSQVRSVKHDINNHVGVLAGLIEQGNNSEAMEYIKSFQDITDMSDFKIKTGNPVTDVVINEKMKEAAQKGIEFTSDFHYPKDSDLNAFDVSIVLTNALTNAVEAVSCADEKFISVSSFRNKNVYLITVTNSFYGKLDINKETGLPKSNKNDGNTHGIGLQNIKMVADKYFGDANLEVKDNTAVLTVMLKIRG